jgi:hypothetical protein
VVKLVLFACLVSFVSQARVPHPKGSKPYKKFEVALSKLPADKRAKALERLYKFYVNKEATQKVKIVSLEKKNWFQDLLIETVQAQSIKSAHETYPGCLNTAARSENGTLIPNTCVYAANIICTSRTSPPGCNREYIARELPQLICEDGSIKCNPDILMTCDGNKISGSLCVDIKKVKGWSPAKGPQLTEACITGYGTITMEQRANEVAKCADFSDGGKVAQAFEQALKFCSTLHERTGQGKFKKDFAGNDQDCEDLMKYFDQLLGNKPPQPAQAAPECDNPKNNLICEGMVEDGCVNCTAYKQFNKVYGINMDGNQPGGIIVCDSIDGGDFQHWLHIAEPTGNLKGLKTFNRDVGEMTNFDLTVNPDGTCTWKWANSDEVVNLHRLRGIKGSKGGSGGSRGPASTDPIKTK